MSTVMPSPSLPLPAPRTASAHMPIARLLRAYWIEARYEVLRTLRTPAFLIPTIALPVMLYVFFGIVLHDSSKAPNPQIALLVITLLLTIATTFGHVELTVAQAAGAALVGVLGVVPFCALGLLIGSLVSGTGAPAVVNLIFFPMIYLSGLFPFPLPKALQTAAMIWPAFHLNQLSLAVLGLPTQLNPWISAEVLIGFAGVCLYFAARRLMRTG